jgi:hypothetical protein
MVEKVLYHVTKNENLSSIMKDGIVKQIGDNSKLNDETELSVYLCEEDEVDIWKILLNGDVVIKVNTDYLDEDYLEKVDYSAYSEIIYGKNIPKKAIIDFKNLVPSTNAMKILAKDLIAWFGGLCACACTVYSYGMDCYRQDLEDNISAVNQSIKLIDIGVLSDEEIANLLKDLAEMPGNVLTDYYFDSVEESLKFCKEKEKGLVDNSKYKKLFEKIGEYDNEDLHKIYEYCKKNFSKFRDLNTGALENYLYK